jgi:tetratricopeptide (TPR) repeat protein
MGDNHKAEFLFKQEIEKIDQFHLDEMKSSLLNGQAICCYDRGSYQEALVLIDEALAKNPEDSILWANHGVICRAAGQSKRSLPSVKKAIRINPATPEFWGSMGYIYMSMGKFDSALPSFEKALSIDPEIVQFMLAAAVCFYRLGIFDRFAETMRLVSVSIQSENSCLSICYDYLQGDKSAALNRLQEMIKTEKIPRSLLHRDSNLHFILGIDTLLSIA